MSAYIYYSNELYHHGILGQKWGVRRYQNADGTRTAAGKKRRKYEPEDLSELSDQEVQQKLNRARNELQYHQTMRQLDKETGVTGKAEKLVNDAKKTLATAVAITGAILVLKKNGGQLVDMALDSIGSGTIPAAAMANSVTRKMF